MRDVEELYKPLRNHLRKVHLLESLGVVRAYIQYLQVGQPLPKDIDAHPRFLHARHPVERGVHAWELDTIARELLLHAIDTESQYAPETFRRWDYFAGAVNKLKAFEDSLYGLSPKGMILLEIHRIAHRQFPWQRPQNAIMLARYFKIFGEPGLDAIIRRRIGLGVKDVYLIGLALAGNYIDNFFLDYPPRIEIPGLDREKLDKFLTHFCIDLPVLKAKAQELQEVNENFAYSMNPLRMWPLVKVHIQGRDRIAAPIPPFFIHRFTEGLYYEIFRDPDFSEAFGESFQKYVGEVLGRANSDGTLRVLPEREYWIGKDRKDTVDWIVEDETAIMCVESKTKRLRLEAKTEIRTTELLERELQKLADFIVQIYKSIRDYRAGHYPGFPFRPGKPAFPVVLTLEEWYSFGDMIQGRMDELVGRGLDGAGIDQAWVREMPYAVCSMADFESLIQVVVKGGIGVVMGRKGDGAEFRKWTMRSYLSDQFGAEMKSVVDLFPELLDEITPAGP